MYPCSGDQKSTFLTSNTNFTQESFRLTLLRFGSYWLHKCYYRLIGLSEHTGVNNVHFLLHCSESWALNLGKLLILARASSADDLII